MKENLYLLSKKIVFLPLNKNVKNLIGMTRRFLIISFNLFLPFLISAQNEPKETPQEEKQYPTTIEGQFDQLIEKSGNWEKYKIVKKESLYAIKNNMLDSIYQQRNLLQEKLDTIYKQSNHIGELKSKIESLEENLEKEVTQKNSINFFGIPLEKDIYSSIVWGIILVLGVLLIVFISKFAKSNSTTRSTLKDFEDLQNEYEEYRTKSIEREQKVRRQLQDEINKHRS